MNRAMIRSHLTQAERHVAEGERHVAHQREIIQRLQDAGHSTVEAERLLCLFEETQQLHVQDRDRMRRELDSMGSSTPTSTGS